jgi:hypothetical protein
MQIALGMTAYQFAILGKGDVALKDTGAHARGSDIRLLGVFRELHGGASVTDREVTLSESFFVAGKEFLLQFTLIHVIDQIVRAGSELNAGFVYLMPVPIVVIITLIPITLFECKTVGCQQTCHANGCKRLANNSQIHSLILI